MPIGTIFKSRKAVGICSNYQSGDDDLILSRIIRLRGIDGGVNSGYDQKDRCVDSYSRYIYLHGTNREDLLGKESS